jgi:hypothetical protein
MRFSTRQLLCSSTVIGVRYDSRSAHAYPCYLELRRAGRRTREERQERGIGSLSCECRDDICARSGDWEFGILNQCQRRHLFARGIEFRRLDPSGPQWTSDRQGFCNRMKLWVVKQSGAVIGLFCTTSEKNAADGDHSPRVSCSECPTVQRLVFRICASASASWWKEESVKSLVHMYFVRLRWCVWEWDGNGAESNESLSGEKAAGEACLCMRFFICRAADWCWRFASICGDDLYKNPDSKSEFELNKTAVLSLTVFRYQCKSARGETKAV